MCSSAAAVAAVEGAAVGVSAVGAAVDSAVGARIGGGVVEGPAVGAAADGATDGVGESGGDATVGVHLTRVGFGAAVPAGGAVLALEEGEWVGVGTAEGVALGVAVGVADGASVDVALGVAAGVGLAAAAMTVGAFVGFVTAPSPRATVVPARARISKPTQASARSLERGALCGRGTAIQAEASLLLMTASSVRSFGRNEDRNSEPQNRRKSER